ncbi:MAG: 16S rRNA (cytidine(1402)-2'-O)-methyltransferase [Candidatus Phytoplasma australasiaticum]|uniref:Ribosomal RNA small subunit methyltransferase I n=2 Tax=16SrII (Peanut WB group) TaxID=85621 RepID=A0A9K3STE3_9MOLU|nr:MULTISPECIES: 16S rRNA (cytidine(1402)-2'-O)-methyltransferase [Phytoplasma]MDV3155130.1 16S rRNA (cytidine(1402)-2'-O)-methyltransferase [Sweet potato little leaf phytoplasma]MCG3566804.1 16S rRNA (cytidine(1402)-2'-O)-methyltransferase [Sesame phyllody phytoplasma]MDO8031236.1 16S rRNA (cytidine(1402)-2'-O)-methyltransferase [Candidatus Phytoplasma australasiaticum]MDO8031603.1 16S rRNA (cytidine(1402)-2'-O)-methyltransferase [Candidatus Phytoplasma australasiaticum]MDO8046652.1 16S rRNA 
MLYTQKTFQEKKATLYLVATPIGNMSDLTFRALDILKQVDYILAEDTRQAYKILKFYQFNNNLLSLHQFNEKQRVSKVLSLLKQNKNLALISNAGTPLISDPGLLLVRAVQSAGFYVCSIPGASAVITAFSISTFDLPFLFLGFLPKKTIQKERILLKYRFFEGTLILFESPMRLLDTLLLIQKHYIRRNISLSKELTKKFETIIYGDINEILKEKEKISFKGEYVITIDKNLFLSTYQYLSLEEHFLLLLKHGYSKKEALRCLSKDRNISKKQIYHYLKIPMDQLENKE